MRPSIFLSGATAALLLARPAHSQTHTRLSQEQYLALGKQYTGWFFNGRTDSLLAHMSPESREASGGPAGILEKRDQVAARAGSEVMVLEEKMTWRKGMPQFWHEGTFDKLDEPVVLRWVMDDKGAIVGIGMGPKSHTPEVDPGPPQD